MVTHCERRLDSEPQLILRLVIGLLPIQNEPEKVDYYNFIQVAVKQSRKKRKKNILSVNRYIRQILCFTHRSTG
jgi:hypothetical protein